MPTCVGARLADGGSLVRAHDLHQSIREGGQLVPRLFWLLQAVVTRPNAQEEMCVFAVKRRQSVPLHNGTNSTNHLQNVHSSKH